MIIENAIACWAMSGVVLIAAGIKIRERIPAHWAFARSAILGIPLGWMFSPTIAVGTIVLPVPAGSIIIMVGSDMIKGIPQVKGPNLGNFPVACFMFIIGSVLFTFGTHWFFKSENSTH